MLNTKTSYFFISLILFSATGLFASTVTVDAINGDSVGTGGIYDTIENAWNDIGTWGDGSDDTIELLDNASHGVGFSSGPTSPGGPTLTIKNATGASPIVQCDGNGFYLVNTLYQNVEFIFENITFIGNNPNADRIFRIERPNGGTNGDYTVTIRNCVITSHNANVPFLDYTSTGLGRSAAMTADWIRINEDRGSGDDFRFTLNVESSTLAFANNHGIFMQGLDQNVLSGSEINLTNCLFSAPGFASLLMTEAGGNVSVNVDECFFYSNNINNDDGTGAFSIQGGGLGATTSPLTISDSIFFNNATADVHFRQLDTTCTITRSTFYTTDPGPAFVGSIRDQFGSPGGNAVYDITDCIFAGNAVRPVILVPSDNGETAIVSTCALLDGTTSASAVITSNAPGIDNAWTGNFISSDPAFIATGDAGLSGRVGWDRTDNNLYDVSAAAYNDAATTNDRPGNALAGGADPQGDAVSGGINSLATRVKNWDYE